MKIRILEMAVATAMLCLACLAGEFWYGTNGPYVVKREFVGKRLHVSVRHGPSRESGWTYPVCYPEFFLTNGDMSAENYISSCRERPCFCRGEWWLVTNGCVDADCVLTRQVWISDDGRIRNENFTNYVPRVVK